MKKLTMTICTTLVLFALAAFPASAQMEHHGGMNDGEGKPHHGMGMRDGSCMEKMDRACPMCGMDMGGKGMAGGQMHELHGMMMGDAAPTFYLDMKEKLGLEPQQVEKLRDIRREFRKDFVRRSAELKIGKMELEDAFQGEWTVDEAEKRLRQIQEQRTDLVVRYLDARKKAENILTEEQLQAVRRMMDQ